MNKALLIIDPQNDFMDQPPGSLAVSGATQDMENLAEKINSNPLDYKQIFVTLDTHYIYHIAHRAYWIDQNGRHPNPWTQITLDDFINGKYTPVDPSKKEWVKKYLESLEQGRKYTLMIWPEHCISGTIGHNVQPKLQQALELWENVTGNKVTFIKKGMNPDSESYSVFKAEVPVPNEPATSLNVDLLNKLNQFDSIDVAGEALSHCVASSCNDLIKNIDASKINLLTDFCSSVTGFEKNGENFVLLMKEKGVNIVEKKSKKLKV